MDTPTTIADLIDNWETIGDFASDAGCGYEAARQMRRRGSIAPEHWPRIIEASERRGINGVTYEWLALQRASVGLIAESRPSFSPSTKEDAA